MRDISLIAAVDLNYGIGKEGKLLFPKQKRDMEYFKGLTINNTVIMGRKTFESLGFRPLKMRRNIVLSSTLKKDDYGGVEIYDNIEDVFRVLDKNEKIFVIGGEQIYREFLNFANKIYLTTIHTTKDADSFFPNFNQDKEFYSTHNGLFGSDELNEFPYSFKTYYRVK